MLDVLRMELARRGVDIQCGVQIVSCTYQKEKNIFRLQDLNGNTYTGDRVIVACGGPASLKNGGMDGYRIAKSFGIKMRELVPGLVQLRTGKNNRRKLQVCGARQHLPYAWMEKMSAKSVENCNLQNMVYPEFRYSK